MVAGVVAMAYPPRRQTGGNVANLPRSGPELDEVVPPANMRDYLNIVHLDLDPSNSAL